MEGPDVTPDCGVTTQVREGDLGIGQLAGPMHVWGIPMIAWEGCAAQGRARCVPEPRAWQSEVLPRQPGTVQAPLVEGETPKSYRTPLDEATGLDKEKDTPWGKAARHRKGVRGKKGHNEQKGMGNGTCRREKQRGRNVPPAGLPLHTIRLSLNGLHIVACQCRQPSRFRAAGHRWVGTRASQTGREGG